MWLGFFLGAMAKIDKGVSRTGGWGYSAVKADEVTVANIVFCAAMFRHAKLWPPDMTPIGVGGLYGGQASRQFDVWIDGRFGPRILGLFLRRKLF